jgi:hypothetical protein
VTHQIGRRTSSSLSDAPDRAKLPAATGASGDTSLPTRSDFLSFHLFAGGQDMDGIGVPSSITGYFVGVSLSGRAMVGLQVLHTQRTTSSSLSDALDRAKLPAATGASGDTSLPTRSDFLPFQSINTVEEVSREAAGKT